MGKKLIVFLMVLVLFISFIPSMTFAASAGQWKDLGSGWKMRVEGPHTGAGKWHVHVNKGNKEVGSISVDKTPSHKDKLNNVPESIRKKVYDHPEFERGVDKQKKLDKAKNQIKAKNLKIDWWHVADVTAAIGIVIAATGTFFFPGDDVGAWINFFRVIGV